MVQLVALGTSYKTAPVELRGRLAWTADQLSAALKCLRGLPGVWECAIISTCNRTELYVVREVAPGGEPLLDFWAEDRGVPVEEISRVAFHMAGGEVARHLMRVASGLESMILGETQILGQVKETYINAQQHGSLGKILHSLFNQAIACGKRVHTETAISQNAVSVSYAAVELARKIFGDLAGHRALLVGAGKMANLTARHLVDNGIEEILVCNRTFARAQEMAREYGGRAVPMEQMESLLVQADVVISSTGSPSAVITRDMVQRAMRARRSRPLFLMDIAVPADVEPAVGNLDNVFLYNIDDLEAVVLANLQEREREAQKAERIIEDEVAKFQNWLCSLDVVPLIRSLREKVEDIRRAEIQRLFNRLPDLSERERELINGTTATIVNKILNDPTLRVKEFAANEQADVYLRAFALLFNLSGDETPGETSAAGDDRGAAGRASPKSVTEA